MKNKTIKFREVNLGKEKRLFLGKNEKSNDELMKKYKGKENIILHTSAPGSPFCVIEKLNPTKTEIYESGIVCAKYSRTWRDNKKDVEINVFTGKDIKKPLFAKAGTWKVKNAKNIKIKKQDIEKFEKS